MCRTLSLVIFTSRAASVKTLRASGFDCMKACSTSRSHGMHAKNMTARKIIILRDMRMNIGESLAMSCGSLSWCPSETHRALKSSSIVFRFLIVRP